ncbi:MAG: hypothetical protein ABII64_08135 [Elusimicrobiota bacterium]
MIYRPEKRGKIRVYGAVLLWLAAGAVFYSISLPAGIPFFWTAILLAVLAPFAVAKAMPAGPVEVSEEFIRDGRRIYRREMIRNPSVYEKVWAGRTVDCGVKFIFSGNGPKSERFISTSRFDGPTRDKIHKLLMRVIPLENAAKTKTKEVVAVYRLRFAGWAVKEQAWFLPYLFIIVFLTAVYYAFNWNSPDRIEPEPLILIIGPAAFALYLAVLLVRWLWLSRYVIRVLADRIMLSDKNGRKPKITVQYKDIVQCEDYVKISGVIGRRRSMNIWLASGEYIPFRIGGYEKENEIAQVFKEKAGK